MTSTDQKNAELIVRLRYLASPDQNGCVLPLADTLREAADALDRTMKALEPFAKAGESVSARHNDLHGALSTLTINDLRGAAALRARAVHS